METNELITYPRGEKIKYGSNVSTTSIHIEDIAHALSNTGRFNGHTSEFFSVAKHSIIMSYIIHEHFRFEALLHDACEAYCGDIITPLKEELTRYEIIEARFEKAVRKKFRLPEQMSQAVKVIDYQAYLCEAKFYTNMETTDKPSPEMYAMWCRINNMIGNLSNPQISNIFLQRYNYLGGNSNGSRTVWEDWLNE